MKKFNVLFVLLTTFLFSSCANLVNRWAGWKQPGATPKVVVYANNGTGSSFTINLGSNFEWNKTQLTIDELVENYDDFNDWLEELTFTEVKGENDSNGWIYKEDRNYTLQGLFIKGYESLLEDSFTLKKDQALYVAWDKPLEYIAIHTNDTEYGNEKGLYIYELPEPVPFGEYRDISVSEVIDDEGILFWLNSLSHYNRILGVSLDSNSRDVQEEFRFSYFVSDLYLIWELKTSPSPEYPEYEDLPAYGTPIDYIDFYNDGDSFRYYSTPELPLYNGYVYSWMDLFHNKDFMRWYNSSTNSRESAIFKDGLWGGRNGTLNTNASVYSAYNCWLKLYKTWDYGIIYTDKRELEYVDFYYDGPRKIEIGDSYEIYPLEIGYGTAFEKIEFISSDPDILYVDGDGILSAVSPGVCEITIRVSDSKKTVETSREFTVIDESGNDDFKLMKFPFSNSLVNINDLRISSDGKYVAIKRNLDGNYLGNFGEVWLSSSYGESWRRILECNSGIMNISSNGKNIIYMEPYNKYISVSNDYGISFSNISINVLPENNGNYYLNECSISDNGNIVVYDYRGWDNETYENSYTIKYSTDGGKTFGTLDLGELGGQLQMSSDGSVICASVFFEGNWGLIYSNDSGAIWHFIQIDDLNYYKLSSDGARVVYSKGSQTFTRILDNDAVEERLFDFETICVSPDLNSFLVKDSDKVLYKSSASSEEQWQMVNGEFYSMGFESFCISNNLDYAYYLDNYYYDRKVPYRWVR